MERVRFGYRAVALSCRGYGDPGCVRANRYPGHLVDDLAEFVQALDAGPVHLVGTLRPAASAVCASLAASGTLRTLVLLGRWPSRCWRQHPARACQGDQAADPAAHAGIGFIKFGAKGMGPAVKAFEHGDDAGALRVFMAANSSDAVVEGIPGPCSSGSSIMPAGSRLRSRPDFPVRCSDARAIGCRRCWSRARCHRRTSRRDRPPGEADAGC